jgi:zinc protease
VTSIEDYKEKLLEKLYAGMLNDRFSELFLKGEAPYLSAGVSIGTLLATTESYYLRGALKESSVYDGIERIFYEHERARRDGFTVSEFERYKTKVLSSAYNSMYSQDGVNSKTYVDLYIDNFIDGVPMPGEDFTYEFYKQILPLITLDEVNKIGGKWIGKNNISIVFSTPDKEGVKLPSDEELKDMLESSCNLEIEPYVPEVVDKLMMKEKPLPGKVLSREYNKKADITVLVLSNGTEVILKPSKFRKDIVMSSFRSGGTSLAPDSLYYSVRHVSDLIYNSGLNGLTISQLRKINVGKQVSVKPSLNFYDELINGKSSLQDIETMFQMTHLYFTNPYKNEAVFGAYKDWLINNAKDADVQPERFFYDEISRVMSQYHKRAIPITPEQYREGFNLDKAFDFYMSRFSNAWGFKFVFVGDFVVDEMIPLIETYIASLPAKKIDEPKSADIGLRYKSGIIKKEYFLQSENKSNVVLHMNGELKHSLEEKIVIDALASVLKLRLYEEVREKMGGVYGVAVSGFTTDNPYEWYRIGVEFVCFPKDVEHIIGIVKQEIEKIKREGPLDSDVTKVREAIRVSAVTGQYNNDYIMSRIKDAIKYKLNFQHINDTEYALKQISKKTLKEAANKYLSGENFAQFILYPKAQVIN